MAMSSVAIGVVGVVLLVVILVIVAVLYAKCHNHKKHHHHHDNGGEDIQVNVQSSQRTHPTATTTATASSKRKPGKKTKPKPSSSSTTTQGKAIVPSATTSSSSSSNTTASATATAPSHRTLILGHSKPTVQAKPMMTLVNTKPEAVVSVPVLSVAPAPAKKAITDAALIALKQQIDPIVRQAYDTQTATSTADCQKMAADQLSVCLGHAQGLFQPADQTADSDNLRHYHIMRRMCMSVYKEVVQQCQKTTFNPTVAEPAPAVPATDSGTVEGEGMATVSDDGDVAVLAKASEVAAVAAPKSIRRRRHKDIGVAPTEEQAQGQGEAPVPPPLSLIKVRRRSTDSGDTGAGDAPTPAIAVMSARSEGPDPELERHAATTDATAASEGDADSVVNPALPQPIILAPLTPGHLDEALEMEPITPLDILQERHAAVSPPPPAKPEPTADAAVATGATAAPGDVAAKKPKGKGKGKRSGRVGPKKKGTKKKVSRRKPTTTSSSTEPTEGE